MCFYSRYPEQPTVFDKDHPTYQYPVEGRQHEVSLLSYLPKYGAETTSKIFVIYIDPCVHRFIPGTS